MADDYTLISRQCNYRFIKNGFEESSELSHTAVLSINRINHVIWSNPLWSPGVCAGAGVCQSLQAWQEDTRLIKTPALCYSMHSSCLHSTSQKQTGFGFSKMMGGCCDLLLKWGFFYIFFLWERMMECLHFSLGIACKSKCN